VNLFKIHEKFIFVMMIFIKIGKKIS